MTESNVRKILQLLFGEFRLSLSRTLAADIRLRLVTSTKFSLRGAQNIRMSDGARLYLGTTFFGFVDRHTRSLVRVRGSLDINGVVRVGRGAAWDIGPRAVVTVGDGTYFSPHVRLISDSEVTIGNRCAIGWGTEILDSDFHRLTPSATATAREASVTIEDHVWIGSGVRILRGAVIPEGCIVAAGSIVTKAFSVPNCLIAGVPARVVKESVSWH